MLARLKDPAQRERIKKDMDDAHATWENQYHGAGGGDGILVVSVFNPELRKYEGLTLSQIGKQLGKDPRDVAMDIVAADRALTRAVNFVMSEDDVRATLKHPLVSVGTDSAAKAEDGPLGPIEVASPRLGLLRKNPRQVRAGGTSTYAGRSDQKNDVTTCRTSPPHRSRRPTAQHDCGYHHL